MRDAMTKTENNKPHYLSHTKEMEFFAFYLTKSGRKVSVTPILVSRGNRKEC